MSSRRLAKAATNQNQVNLAGQPSQVRNLRSRKRVYLASSLGTYWTPDYERALESLARAFPNAEILAARDLYTSNSEWLNKWPAILLTLDELVFIEDRDGFIGYGVYTEIIDALAHDIPIRFLTKDGQLCDIAMEDDDEPFLTEFRPFDRRQFARIAYVMNFQPGSPERTFPKKASRDRERS